MKVNRETMDTNKKNTKMDMKEKLSLLWIFAIFNYLYADIVSLMDSVTLKQLMTGYVGSIHITKGFLLGAAILMETAIVMVILSRVLKYRVNRWANIIVGAIHTVAVLLSMVLAEALPSLYYLFFGTIEILCTLLIIWYAWKWPNPESSPN